MKIANQPSWQVITDSPESLNFAIYVGYACGLHSQEVMKHQELVWPELTHPITDRNKRLRIKRAWKKWWLQLLNERQESTRPNLIPPYTTGIHSSDLVDICNKIWPEFRKWWRMPAGGQAAMIFSPKWDRKNTLQTFIRQSEMVHHKCVRPFQLKIDFVYGGLLTSQDVTTHYVVMPLLASYRFDPTWWEQKLLQLESASCSNADIRTLD